MTCNRLLWMLALSIRATFFVVPVLVLEERSIGKSTVFTTQLALDHWSEVIADPVIADAIRDRLQHAALIITITGESYRGVKARKLAGGGKAG